MNPIYPVRMSIEFRNEVEKVYKKHGFTTFSAFIIYAITKAIKDLEV